jgi:dCTP deaminase
VVSFDPDTFEVGYHRITGWYEGPPDRVYEVELASGRWVRVTAGHNLFTLDRHGRLAKTRTLELAPGTRVAIPRSIPDPKQTSGELDLPSLAPNHERHRLMCTGPTVAQAFNEFGDDIAGSLQQAGIHHADYYRSRMRLPLSVADQVPGLVASLTKADRLSVRGAGRGFPTSLPINPKFAWLLGLYVAEGSRRRTQFTLSNTNQAILDHVQGILTGWHIPTYRSDRAVTGCSAFHSAIIKWLGAGEGAPSKRIPPIVFGWSRDLLEAFFDGLVDGDGSREETRTSVWTCSAGLVADLLLLAERLGKRAATSVRARNGRPLWQIYFPTHEHKLLTSVPLPDRLLIEIRKRAGLTQVAASRLAGYRHASDLNNIEQRTGREAVRLATLRRLRSAYARRPECRETLPSLNRLVDGGLLWDRVVAVRDTGSVEPIFDLEVRPGGRKVENFLAGSGGVFVSNTAGFVDAGWDGHLTLELSNVANLPIAIYPGMKIGQISFLRMTTPADRPYGTDATDSKYQGQRGPTPSRYYRNFRRDG